MNKANPIAVPGVSLCMEPISPIITGNPAANPKPHENRLIAEVVKPAE
ncbi:hypothetical protein EZS27_023542 [termite gut metagenome]|uniref:Uncharacterized protein n=1 Tax=termite gut metagenome TaxID=433724 RepID=A0A5J4R175_9ZZZZ